MLSRILADVPPRHDELIHANTDRGFALASVRSATRSRYYIQAPLTERFEDWPEERAWDDLAHRFDPISRHGVKHGPGLDDYQRRALARIWKAERFSWYLTKLTHRFPEDGAFEHHMQIAELEYVPQSEAMQTVIAENYVGLPL